MEHMVRYVCAPPPCHQDTLRQGAQCYCIWGRRGGRRPSVLFFSMPRLPCLPHTHPLQNADKFKSTMHSLTYGGVMAAAARDLQKVGRVRGERGAFRLHRASGRASKQRAGQRRSIAQPSPSFIFRARAHTQEMLAENSAAAPSGRDIDIDDLLDDPELEASGRA